MERVLTLTLLCALFALGQLKPPDVKNVILVNQTESSLTFQWERVEDITLYRLQGDGLNDTINSKEHNVTYTVSSLYSGTNYSFTLFTEFEGNVSDGYNFSGITVPSDVEVSIINQNESAITLQWAKGNDSNTFELKYINSIDVVIPSTDSKVEHTVTSLSSGTEYAFTLFTVFGKVKSKGHKFSGVTVPSDVLHVLFIDRNESAITLQWNSSNDYTYELRYRNYTETATQTSPSDSMVEHTVTSLFSGTEYVFTLYTLFKGLNSSGRIFSEVTVPSKVENVSLAKNFDTNVTLKWKAVENPDNNKYNYTLDVKSNRNSRNNINITQEGDEVICYISDLIPATSYSFTVYTEFFDAKSNGYISSHTTTLSDITEVTVIRSPTALTIAWNKLNNNNIYNYTLRESNGREVSFSGSQQEFNQTYASLTQGTKYSFTLFVVVFDNRSTGYNVTNVTTINCEFFMWKVTNTSIHAQVYGSTYVTAQNSTGNTKSASVEDNMVNLPDLYPGGHYTVSLFYDLKSEKLLQCSQHLTLDPNSVSRLRCEFHSGGYGLAVLWEHPFGVVEKVQVDVDKKSFNISAHEATKQLVTGLQVAQWYKVTVKSFSGDRKSEVSTNCQTNPAGVIAGVLVFFLLVIIICAAVFIWIRYGSAKLSNKRTKGAVIPNLYTKNYKPIPLNKFPEIFESLSRDTNRGFSEEYEDLSSVGTEQYTIAALLPENKDKNRFSNVSPYDHSRVHLIVNTGDESDYINANYMPGYGNASRQYIAAQGPLPSTVSDFWRMVWDQKSQAIVMVTNCTESGRVKCEQYWPLDYTPCLYGNLLVTVNSEEKARSWTLREFNVKNKNTSETRTVRHFHFTAWPDHGVPYGTEELIQFRGLVRQHIESSTSAGPTVVHCSAGVGRTGTLIALDVLLQQMAREKAVGIAAFVQEMRLNRPLMVQTESQYMFLHQCIMDSLQPTTVNSDPLYENSDMIYVNAIALKEYEKASQI